jgi:Zn ribbon nucleic-acid-binding protein
MIMAKGCPRCSGDLTLVFDVDESYFSCVQCGYLTYERPRAVHAPPPRIRERAASRERGRAPVGSGHARRSGTRAAAR